MARTPADPTDYSRTTQPHAGEFMKDTRGLPGYLLMGVAVLAVVACVASAGYGHQGWKHSHWRTDTGDLRGPEPTTDVSLVRYGGFVSPRFPMGKPFSCLVDRGSVTEGVRGGRQVWRSDRSCPDHAAARR
jgi:hypothetical protein